VKVVGWEDPTWLQAGIDEVKVVGREDHTWLQVGVEEVEMVGQPAHSEHCYHHSKHFHNLLQTYKENLEKHLQVLPA
jgi:hypothetical protein